MAIGPDPGIDDRKLATVLFADLVGSTQLGGSQDPERTRALLERLFSAMSEEIERVGGTVEKFVGDAVMAAFGAPAALEDHAERALFAALALQHRMKELFGEEVHLRVGVNTGEVVVGFARAGGSFATGDAVNVAARLEQAAAPDEILVGVRTVGLASAVFEFSEQMIIEAKGKPEGVVCRRLLGVRAVSQPRLAPDGRVAALIGRGAEFASLRGVFLEAVSTGQPAMVTLTGEAGVGKSRLAVELRTWFEAETDVRSLEGRCLSYGRGITYWPLAEIFRQLLGVNEADDGSMIMERLAGREILGLTFGLDVAGDLHPFAAKERLHDAWVEVVNELAAGGPVFFLIEDIHWAEGSLLELLERIATDARGPVLFLNTARPEFLDMHPEWGGRRRGATTMSLEPLSPELTRDLLAELLDAPVPDAVVELIVSRAEGNPFYVEEMVRMLIDRGILIRVDERWSVRDTITSIAVPDSVQAVLASRIDLLEPKQKATVQAAAVIGRTFWVSPVHLLVRHPPDLRTLEEREFVRRVPESSIPGEREFAFRHALTRQVAYEGLPKARRARLHAAFADWLEEGSDDRDDRAPLLAHHYGRAGAPENADLAFGDDQQELDRVRVRGRHWLLRAADLAIGRYALNDALALLHEALQLEPPVPEQALIWSRIGRAHALQYEGEPFWNAMQRAIELSPEPETQGELYAELAFEVSARWGMFPNMPRRDLVNNWIDQALALSTAPCRARARALVARCYWHPDRTYQDASEAASIADGLTDQNLRSHAYNAASTACFVAGDYDEARTWAQRRLDAIADITDPDLVADVYSGMIPCHLGAGHFDEARRFADLHAEVAGGLSPHHRVHAVAMVLEVEELAGDWPAIRALREQTEHAVAENRATPCVRNARSLLVSALADLTSDDPSMADRHEAEAFAIMMPGADATYAPLRVWIALARGDLDAVELLLPAAVPPPPAKNWWHLATYAARLDALAALGDGTRVAIESRSFLRPGTYLEPFALRAIGRTTNDKALLRDAADHFEAMGLRWHAEQTRVET